VNHSQNTNKRAKEKDTGSRVFDSMAQAAKVMGIPLPLLKAMTRDGCPGFVASRVYEEKVLKWLEENPQSLSGSEGEENESMESLKKKLLREQIRKARESADAGAIDNAKKRSELVSRQDLEFAIPKCLAHAISIQRKHLPTEIFNLVCKETKEGFGRILNEAKNVHTDDESDNPPTGI
jgi:phage terminase Nu1 subunit (DNA packaging protein)